MAVFVSYARPDEPQAARIADALRANGYEAWRDTALPAHRPYAEVIEERLNSAEAVVVLWSAHAAKSQWVRAEADSARNRGALIQASLDGTIPPIPFNQIQCADLNGADDPAEAAGWPKLIGSVQELVGTCAANQGGPSVQRRQQVSICVLPFANMSGDAEQEYFSDGISEDITTDLSKVSALAVTARNTAFMFKGRAGNVCEIAKKLDVSHVLEGSVRKAGGRLRITAQLIDGQTGDHVWAERYDRDLTDIFAIQDEISRAIVTALKVKLLPEEKMAIEQRGTTNVEAYNLYLMAHNYWVTTNWGDVRQLEMVARICRRAIGVDDNYARAWGLLAIIESILHFSHEVEEVDGLTAAERALSLDPNLAEALVVKARHAYEAERLDEANEALERAVELDPDSWEVNREAGRICYVQRRFAEAAVYFEKAASISETDFHSYAMLTSIYEALGDKDALTRAAQFGLARAERVAVQNPTNSMAVVLGAVFLAFLGEKDRFTEWADRALLIDPDNAVTRFNLAASALQLTDPGAALEFLDPAFKTVSLSMFKAALTDPDLDSLRELPRFKAMVSDAQARLHIKS